VSCGITGNPGCYESNLPSLRLSYVMITTIICSHNPERQVLSEVLGSLRTQSHPMSQWELLVIDNSSSDAEPIEQWIDLSWHPSARCIRETTLGLTTARLTGFRSANHDVIVYIDDDNLLDSAYLATVQSIADRFPQLGVWGAGIISPRFEVTPEEWTKQYWFLLALRNQQTEEWSHSPSQLTTVVGAGMCVRRCVLQKYSELVAACALRSSLDPIGKQLNRAGDQDLFHTAYDLSLGTGVFPSLQMTHVIPEFRLKEDYLLRLVDGYVYSNCLLSWIRNLEPYSPPSSLKKVYQFIRSIVSTGRKGRFYRAAIHARARAERDYLQMKR